MHINVNSTIPMMILNGLTQKSRKVFIMLIQVLKLTWRYIVEDRFIWIFTLCICVLAEVCAVLQGSILFGIVCWAIMITPLLFFLLMKAKMEIDMDEFQEIADKLSSLSVEYGRLHWKPINTLPTDGRFLFMNKNGHIWAGVSDSIDLEDDHCAQWWTDLPMIPECDALACIDRCNCNYVRERIDACLEVCKNTSTEDLKNGKFSITTVSCPDKPTWVSHPIGDVITDNTTEKE